MNRDLSESGFDLQQVDRLLTTTRAVRKRLDFARDISDEIISNALTWQNKPPPVVTMRVDVGW